MSSTINISRVSEENIDPSMMDTISTGREVLDSFLSSQQGYPRGTATMIYGDPGIGKSTVTMDMIANMHENGYNVLYVSAEMRKPDVVYMANRFPIFAEIPVWYVDYRVENPLEAFEAALREDAYDFVVIDSLATFHEIVNAIVGGSKKSTLVHILNIIQDMMEGVDVNGKKHFMSFALIQQITKGGDFHGSKMIEHLVTASLKLTFGDDNSRYMFFEKNRRGEGGGDTKRLYFDIGQDYLSYDQERKKTEDEALEFQEKEKERQEKRNKAGNINDLLKGSKNDGDSKKESVMTPEEAPDEVTFDIDEDLDPSDVSRVLRENGGNVSATFRALKDEALIPDSVSRYYVQKFIDENGLERRTHGA